MKRLCLTVLLGLAFVNLGLAQTEMPRAEMQSTTQVQPTLAQLSEIRQALAPYEDVNAAVAVGYEPFMECMSGPQGAQGMHYTKSALIDDPTLDALQPEALTYEQRSDGSLRLIGVEYLVFQEAWHAAGNKPAPVLLGREFYLNTTLLEQPFYGLHLWLWQYNPLDVFANWNPLVSCP
jgi:hypothetical protein